MIDLGHVFGAQVERIKFFEQTKNLEVREAVCFEDALEVANTFNTDEAYENYVDEQDAQIDYFMSLNHDG